MFDFNLAAPLCTHLSTANDLPSFTLSGTTSAFASKSVPRELPHIACNERQAFFTSGDTKRYKLWSCQNVCEALIYLLDNIYIRLGTKLYRQIIGIPMGTFCAHRVADLFLICYERDLMTSLSDVKQAEIIEAFKSTSRYLDDLLILTVLTLKAWSIEFIHLDCS